MSCLRPAPPTRSFIGAEEKRALKKKGERKMPFEEEEIQIFLLDPDTTYEEDMQILRVIEAYAANNKRNTNATSSELISVPI